MHLKWNEEKKSEMVLSGEVHSKCNPIGLAYTVERRRRAWCTCLSLPVRTRHHLEHNLPILVTLELVLAMGGTFFRGSMRQLSHSFVKTPVGTAFCFAKIHIAYLHLVLVTLIAHPGQNMTFRKSVLRTVLIL